MEYISLLAGFALLIYSADYLVKGGVQVANRFHLSPLVIGMTIVAFGTSAPELVVSLMAAIKGNSDIAVGNVVGSNIVNIGLILGVTAMICPMYVNRRTYKIDIPVLLVGSAALIAALWDDHIDRIEGLAGFLMLIAYIAFVIRLERNKPMTEAAESPDITTETEASPQGASMPMWQAILMIIVSSAGLALGAHLLVEGATAIATQFGVSERIIGITVVAIGTSLPELATSVVAALRKETDISVGNIIGSNLFNILAVLSISSMIQPIESSFAAFSLDIYWMLYFVVVMTIMVFPWLVNLKAAREQRSLKPFLSLGKADLGRYAGAIILISYIIYLISIFR